MCKVLEFQPGFPSPSPRFPSPGPQKFCKHTFELFCCLYLTAIWGTLSVRPYPRTSCAFPPCFLTSYSVLKAHLESLPGMPWFQTDRQTDTGDLWAKDRSRTRMAQVGHPGSFLMEVWPWTAGNSIRPPRGSSERGVYTHMCQGPHAEMYRFIFSWN